jgi:hypothetical protein
MVPKFIFLQPKYGIIPMGVQRKGYRVLSSGAGLMSNSGGFGNSGITGDGLVEAHPERIRIPRAITNSLFITFIPFCLGHTDPLL